MIFRNSKHEMKIINKLDFSNDIDYYNAVKHFMNVNMNNNNDYNSEKNKLLVQMKQLINNQ